MKIFLFLSLLLLEKSQTLKILSVLPTPAKSHYIIGSSLMRGLAEKGHEVTVISLYGEKSPPKNYRDIVAGNGFNADPSGFDLFTLDKMNFIVYNIFMNAYGTKLSENIFSDSKVQQLVNSGEKFNVVIMEQFANDGLNVFAHHFQAHLVLYGTFGSSSWVNPLVANPAPPSYIPEQNIQFDHRNFWDRLHNMVVHIFGLVYRNLVFFPNQDEIMKKYFPGAPDLKVLTHNVSLVLLNSHISTNMAVPRVPNMIDIGGVHLKPPKKLPEDLQKYLDEAKDGVVYFSMGSALQSVNLPTEKRETLLKVFAKLKQKVLWKWEGDVLPGQPKKVKLGKWLPQQDILAHPNIKAFITHGGLLSFLESVYHGIPLLALPVFGDQIWNAKEVTKNVLGRHIPFADLDETRLEEALKDVLTNPKYRENMKRRSEIMNDRRHSPVDEADYWLRYVVKHQGAGHLRVGGLDLSWYQLFSLDVAAFALGVILVVSWIATVVFRLVLRRIMGGKKEKIKKN